MSKNPALTHENSHLGINGNLIDREHLKDTGDTITDGQVTVIE